ncbi:MAG: PEP-CTERM system TPR-repeat protein PrsT [Gammaproteobacteria bacterium]|nr:PEP-CTERM system TPR-repeat protein PrsT [Gammaproteobacteria bacterium]
MNDLNTKTLFTLRIIMSNLHSIKNFIMYCFLAGLFFTLASCNGFGTSEQQMLENAKEHMEKGSLEAAAIELRNTLQKNSNNAEARFLLGGIGLEIGYLTSAEKEYRKAASSGWSREKTQLGLARVFLLKQKHKKLLDEITIVDTWSPTARANILALRARAESNLGNIGQAKTSLNNGRTLDSTALEILKTTIIFQFSGIHDGSASATLEKAIALYPKHTELLLLNSDIAIRNKNFKHAANIFKEIIDLDTTTVMTRDARDAHIGLIRIQIIEKKYADAKATLKPLLDRNNKDPEVNFLGGLLAYLQNDYDRAEEYLRNLLKIAPKHHQSQLLMGRIKYALKDYDQAAQFLTAYLAAAPDELSARKLLSATYIALHQYQHARVMIQNALSIDPADSDSLTLLSQIKFRSGNMGEGIQALKDALNSNPNNLTLHKQLIMAYINSGKTAQALIEIESYKNLNNDPESAQKLTIKAHQQAGQINKAISIANDMLERKPQDAEINSLNGRLYAANNNHALARQYFNIALKLEQHLLSATLGLADLERNKGNFDVAENLYKRLVESDTGGAIPMLALSELASEQNNTSDMLFWLEKARKTEPTDIKSRALLADHYLHNAQAKKAYTYIHEAIKISPEDTKLLTLHGKILASQKRYSEALYPLKKLVIKLPNSSKANALLGETLLHLRMIKEARIHIQKAISIQNDNILALSLLAETEFKVGNYNKSISYAKIIQAIQPDHLASHVQEGDAWLAKQDYNNAYTAFSKAWKQQQTAKLAKRLFFSSDHKGDFENAIMPLLLWLKDNPNDEITHLFLADAYQNAGQNDKAIKQYKIALLKLPDDRDILNNLAWLYSLSSNPAALDFAERAYRLAPSNFGILDTYGWVLLQQGQASRGLHLIQQALEQMPDNHEIRYHYAAALIKTGDTDKGKEQLKSLLNENKAFIGRDEAQRLLKTK